MSSSKLQHKQQTSLPRAHSGWVCDSMHWCRCGKLLRDDGHSSLAHHRFPPLSLSSPLSLAFHTFPLTFSRVRAAHSPLSPLL